MSVVTFVGSGYETSLIERRGRLSISHLGYLMWEARQVYSLSRLGVGPKMPMIMSMLELVWGP